jgi:hypothetical protein
MSRADIWITFMPGTERSVSAMFCAGWAASCSLVTTLIVAGASISFCSTLEALSTVTSFRPLHLLLGRRRLRSRGRLRGRRLRRLGRPLGGIGSQGPDRDGGQKQGEARKSQQFAPHRFLLTVLDPLGRRAWKDA